MIRLKTLTVDWDGLGDADEDDELFFDPNNRLSTAVPLDLPSSSDEEGEDFDDSRMSFASAISSIHSKKYKTFSQTGIITLAATATTTTGPNYDIWTADPGSITERRKKLLFGMGLDENKESLKATSAEIGRAISKKFETNDNPSPPPPPSSSEVNPPSSLSGKQKTEQEIEHSPVPFVLVRPRSEGDIEFFSMAKARKEDMIGKVSKQRLTRMATEIALPRSRMIPHADGSRMVVKDTSEAEEWNQYSRKISSAMASSEVGAFFFIKNLDTGKEFIVKEYGENGMWNRLSDLHTGKQLTMEEFEKTVGHSTVVKEFMRRAKAAHGDGYSRKLSSHSYIARSLRMSKRRGAALLKNIKGVASGFREREREVPAQVQPPPMTEPKPGTTEWVRVRQSGKSCKEFSALHFCQEFQAHEGCIWTMKFSLDGHYLASAGEDKTIHIWEVQECELMSLRPEEGNLKPIHPSLLESPSLSSGDKKKKGKLGNMIPDYVHIPETVFCLSDKPYCSFQGHQDEVLDLSWSKS